MFVIAFFFSFFFSIILFAMKNITLMAFGHFARESDIFLYLWNLCNKSFYFIYLKFKPW